MRILGGVLQNITQIVWGFTNLIMNIFSKYVQGFFQGPKLRNLTVIPFQVST